MNVLIFRLSIYQNFLVHISRNSADIISSISTKVSHAMLFLHQTMLLFSSSITVIGLMVMLMLIEPYTVLVAVVVLGTFYSIIIRLSRDRLKKIGEVMSVEVPRTYMILHQSFEGFREILISQTQEFYCQEYRDSDLSIRNAQAENVFISMAPRQVIEAIAIISISCIAFLILDRFDGSATFVAVLGALTYAAQRMLPAVQIMFAAWANIQSSLLSVADVARLLSQRKPDYLSNDRASVVPFCRSITLNHVSFRFEGPGSSWVLDRASLEIKKGSRVAIIGPSGAGKSTLLDIVSGLLQPSEGEIQIDDMVLSASNSSGWQKNIAYVPQTIFVLDATVAENVALGIPLQEIDMERVKTVCGLACIADVIEAKPEKYKTRLGERGVGFSGGQRQRLALARALYRSPSVLILDEATSALDGSTEHTILRTLSQLDSPLTIIMATHRLASLEHFDTVVELKLGKIKSIESYDVFAK